MGSRMQKLNCRFTPLLAALTLTFSCQAFPTTANFLTLSAAERFCSTSGTICSTITPLRLGYTVSFEIVEDPNSGPQLGKGGDDG